MMRYTQCLLTIQLCHQNSEELGLELSPSVYYQGSAHPIVSQYIIIIIIINIHLLQGCSTTRGKQTPIGHVTL